MNDFSLTVVKINILPEDGLKINNFNNNLLKMNILVEFSKTENIKCFYNTTFKIFSPRSARQIFIPISGFIYMPPFQNLVSVPLANIIIKWICVSDGTRFNQDNSLFLCFLVF